MVDGADLPGLRSVDATTTANPLWYVLSIIFGFAGFLVMLKHIPAGMSIFTAAMIFVVLPFGIPVAVVAFATWFTNWQTDERGITKSRFGYERQMFWADVNSARLLGSGSTELLAGQHRMLVPSKDLTLTASVWQHLRETKGFSLPDPIASLWDAPPEHLPDEVTWENRQRIGFWQVHAWQVLAALVALQYVAVLLWKPADSSEEKMSQLLAPCAWLLFAFAGARHVARRVTASLDGLVAEVGRQRFKLAWDTVYVRVQRRAICLNSGFDLVIPLNPSDPELPVLLAVMFKHMRAQRRPQPFVIPAHLRLG